MTATPIAVVAAVISDASGRTLLVRKRGTAAWMQAGGKRESGEEDIAAVGREVREELGCMVQAAAHMGTFSAPAANEAGRLVVADVYRVTVSGEIEASAEIEELLWVDPCSPPPVNIAPLTRDYILPLLVQENSERKSHG